MNLEQLRRFVAAAEELHFPRAAQRLGVPLPALYSTIDKLEEEVGHALFSRDGAKPRLTKAGMLLLADATEELAVAAPPPPKAAGSAGGKAKASKGKGRAPIVKGQPKPYKKRQGR